MKPFDPDELLSRIRAVWADRQLPLSERGRDQVGEIRIDASRREVWRGSRLIDLTAMEFDILDLLVRSPGRIVARHEITETLFERKATPSDRSLDVHISRLRKKLESGHTLIRTIRGVGYVFTSAESRSKSLYFGILLAMAGTLSLSLVALFISRQIERNTVYTDLRSTDELQLERPGWPWTKAARPLSSLFATREQGFWWFSLSTERGWSGCRFRRRPVQPGPWRRSGPGPAAPRRRTRDQSQSHGWRLLVHRRRTLTVAPLVILPLLPPGDRRDGYSLLGPPPSGWCRRSAI